MTVKTDKCNFWNKIDWKSVETQVFKLQKRIYKASQRGDKKAVHRLQKLLTKSHYGKLLATRRVTQDNQGKKTAGVDGQKSLSQKQRIELLKSMDLTGKAKPLRRVWIPKPDRTQRGLGIPTIRDRALQALAKLAMEPEWEAKFEPNSYGFRIGRSGHDAIEAIFGSIRYKSKYVLDADIEKCFDKINHEKLLEKINAYPTLKRTLKQWLKAGIIDKNVFSETETGTPQGGVISPLLANIALHGMEERIKEFADSWKGSKVHNRRSISLIRYADDFVIMHEDLEKVLEAKKIIEEWLAEIGLKLKETKTKITHTLKSHDGNIGFDFLGFTVRQFPAGKNQTGKNTQGKLLGFKTIITPSKEKTIKHLQKIKEVIRRNKNTPQEVLIGKLNPIIRGWTNYYSTVCSKETYAKCSHLTFRKLERWGYKRHPNKSKTWVNKKYWKTKGKDGWTFGYKTEKGHITYLMKHQEKPISRYIKVKGTKSPYDGDWVYWSSTMGKYCEVDKLTAFMAQKAKR
jgi:RNA-directed DNA polymerase